MSALLDSIQIRLRKLGALDLAEFMEHALYDPDHGYYATQDARGRVGKGGDFYTSVSVGPAFGRLLARNWSVNWSAWTPGL